MTDIRHGFIITYFKSNKDCEKILSDLVKTVSRKNIYLILASHTSDVPLEIQKMCDFYFYEELNIVDNKKYSHGVAENSLIQISLNHLKLKKINWTFKCSYDVIIEDTNQFDLWIKDYKYNFVSCVWGNNFLATHSFFANVNFILENINFYDSIDEMFSVNNTLENCWQRDIERKNLTHEIFSFPSKQDFFGKSNSIDVFAYDYKKLNFWYSKEENRFFCEYHGPDFEGTVKIFDYYSDLCLYSLPNFKHASGITMWFSPPFLDSIKNCQNGWYIEYEFPELTLRSNFAVNDFNKKDALHKTFRTFKSVFDMKYNEYDQLSKFDLYKNAKFNIDFLNVKNYVDIGANFGFGSYHFIKNSIKCYMIEPDPFNLKILNTAYSKNSKIKILPFAISDLDGEVTFYSEEAASVCSSLYEANANDSNSNRQKISVKSITPNTLIQKYIEEDSIDLLKLDIEGAEYLFFDTITDENIKKIKKFVIEFHNNENHEIMKILNKLTKNDFSFKLDNWGSYVNPYIIDNKMGIIYAWR